MLSKPFPEPPSSPNVYIPPSFFFNREQDCVFFNHHLNNSDQILSGDGENITTINQQFSEGPVLQSGDQDHDELIDLVNSCTKNKTRVFKKDGKNKIYTAQGPRDRRVRLSIDISRKFFCLQDSLGFDKASKTVDWLFARCKTSIMELVEETNHCSSSTATDQSKMIFLESVMGSGLDKKKGKKKKTWKKSIG